jgi:hypothetical protein
MSGDQELLNAANQAHGALYEVSSMIRTATALLRACTDYERSNELLAVISVLDMATDKALSQGNKLGEVV